MLTPSIGFCFTPLTSVGSGMPAASRMVGAMSMTWWNCERTPPCVLDAVRPRDHQRVAHAAEVRGDLLAPLERRVHRPGPADREVVVGLRPADLVEVLQHERRRRARRPPSAAISLNEPYERALHRGAVVADDAEDERVVELAHLLECVEDAANLVVGLGGVGRERLHQPCGDASSGRASASRTRGSPPGAA